MRITHSILSLFLLVGVFVALGVVFGPGVAAFAFVLAALTAAFGYRRGMKLLRQRMKEDPVGTMRSMDRRATREGKFYSGVSFATMGVCIVAIIAIFATHA